MDRPRGNFLLMMDLRKQIFIFRDLVDISTCDGSSSIAETILGTLDDLQRMYPEIVPREQLLGMKAASLNHVLFKFSEVLKSIGDLWTTDPHWLDSQAIATSDSAVDVALVSLNCLINLARDKADVDEDGFAKNSPRSGSQRSFCGSPVTPTSVLSGFMDSPRSPASPHIYCSSPSLRSMRIQAVEKLNAFDVKRVSFHVSTRECAKDTRDELIFEMDDNGKTLTSPLPPVNIPGTLLPRTEIPTTPILLVPNQSNVAPAAAPLAESILTLPKNMLPAAPTTPVKTPDALPYPKHTIPRTPLKTQETLFQKNKIPAAPPPPEKNPATFSFRKHTITAAPIPPATIPAPPPPATPTPTNQTPAPPPPPLTPKQIIPTPPLSIPAAPAPPLKGATPPPPPLGNLRALHFNKVQTKLKRSSHMGNLYRILKGKIEGGNKNSPNGRKCSSTSNSGGKQGMADALAEMTKRSAYFQQIEEDMLKYATEINKLKASILSFQNKDMKELVKFHSQVERVLENLTDETQVLARFEGFPEKKLEALRMAAALHSKLEGMLTELRSWKFESPVRQILDRVERYFTKIKGEIDSLDRSKDEEAKKFESHKIHFDFDILLQIKEAIVDVSSNCMELALKERGEAAETRLTGEKQDSKKACAKMLWRAFQFAFRVYTFAGGHDDRADNLTRELAHEIQTDPQHQ